MRNDATIRGYLEKVIEGHAKVEAELEKAREDVRVLESQSHIIYGQRMTLEQLLDYDSVPPTIEYPEAGEKIEEMHEKRLQGPQGLSEEETLKERKDVYFEEAMNNAREIDAVNKESAGQDTENDTEGSEPGWSIS